MWLTRQHTALWAYSVQTNKTPLSRKLKNIQRVKQSEDTVTQGIISKVASQLHYTNVGTSTTNVWLSRCILYMYVKSEHTAVLMETL